MFLHKNNLKLAKKIIIITIICFSMFQINPGLAQAYYLKEVVTDYGRGPVITSLENSLDGPSVAGEADSNLATTSLPENSALPYYETYITATAYTSREVECDDDPYTAAWGDHVFWGMIASNSFPKGTKIQIPDYFGNKMFSVLDTMNDRYYYRLDVWMPDLSEAKAWGTRYIKIRVFK
jgi:3D (Asp-Asp-Asp) domain-containing protein